MSIFHCWLGSVSSALSCFVDFYFSVFPWLLISPRSCSPSCGSGGFGFCVTSLDFPRFIALIAYHIIFPAALTLSCFFHFSLRSFALALGFVPIFTVITHISY